MAWPEQAARSLTETFDGPFEAAGVAVAAAGIDIASTGEAGTAVHAGPADTPAEGRFEIGSVTKTMTATRLALMAAEGTLGLDDEIGRWLSAGANGWITPRKLATHTSGLPRMAPNFRPADPDNFWAGFTRACARRQRRSAPRSGRRRSRRRRSRLAGPRRSAGSSWTGGCAGTAAGPAGSRRV